MRLEGKVAIVTGGGMGIGRSACHLLAREGAKVTVTDVSENDTMQAVEDIKRAGGTAECWHLDVTKEIELKNTFAEIEAELQRIDVLANNAGISGVVKPAHEITEAEWDQLTAVNVKGVFICVKDVIPHLKKGGGASIISLSSIYGLVGVRNSMDRWLSYHGSRCT